MHMTYQPVFILPHDHEVDIKSSDLPNVSDGVLNSMNGSLNLRYESKKGKRELSGGMNHTTIRVSFVRE